MVVGSSGWIWLELLFLAECNLLKPFLAFLWCILSDVLFFTSILWSISSVVAIYGKVNNCGLTPGFLNCNHMIQMKDGAF